MDELRERLTRIETIVERLDHELLGNGQPGLISKHDVRISSLETDRTRMWVVVSVATATLGLAGDYIKHHIFGGKG